MFKMTFNLPKCWHNLLLIFVVINVDASSNHMSLGKYYPSSVTWWSARYPSERGAAWRRLSDTAENDMFDTSQPDHYDLTRNGKHIEPSAYDDENKNAAPYEVIGLHEMEYNDFDDCFYYPCPCGDRFVLTSAEYAAGRRIAPCPSCSLVIRVV